ncbi:MAG: DUF308 domain-containing protein [Bacilli bacterium]|nr:DUF308 domain-containing protein [Bacilli bacterium]
MNDLMSKFFRSSIIGSLGLAILGILLIFYSEITIVSISYVIGAILIAIGVLAALRYVKTYNNINKNEMDVVYGIVCIILGIIVITNPEAIASIIPIVVAVVIIVSSATKLQYGLELKKSDNDLWKSTIIISIISLLCGVLLIFNPFKGAVMVTRIVGILILIYALLDISSTISIKRSVKKIQSEIEEIVEAEVIEDKTPKKLPDKKKSKKGKVKKEEKETKEEENNE